MPGLHLNHYVSWDDLLELCYVYEDPGIKLPICECGRIQASEKKVQHQIKNRKYLDDKICTSADCKIVGEKIFKKHERKRIRIPYSLCTSKFPRVDDAKPNVFWYKFKMAIKDFAETERRKIKDRNIIVEGDVENYCKEIEKKLREEEKWPLGDPPWVYDEGPPRKRIIFIGVDCCEWWSCSCKLFSVLLEDGDPKTLLSMPNKKIKEVLNCHHGGQAVGRNIRFLSDFVLQVYCYTNLIFAAGLQDKPDQWGPMKPDDRLFRQFLMYDCDGQTFLFGCRKYLTDEAYMKDFDAMKELCKKCFQFLYLLEMLQNEIGYEYKISDCLGI